MDGHSPNQPEGDELPSIERRGRDIIHQEAVTSTSHQKGSVGSPLSGSRSPEGRPRAGRKSPTNARPKAWWAEGAMDAIWKDDSVGSIVPQFVMPKQVFGDLVDVKRNVKHGLSKLPSINNRGRQVASRPSTEPEFFEEPQGPPTGWSRNATLSHYRMVAFNSAQGFHDRRAQAAAVDERPSAEGRRLRREAMKGSSYKAIPAELYDPSLVYLQGKRNRGWDLKSLKNQLQENGLCVMPEPPQTANTAVSADGALGEGEEGLSPPEDGAVESQPGMPSGEERTEPEGGAAEEPAPEPPSGISQQEQEQQRLNTAKSSIFSLRLDTAINYEDTTDYDNGAEFDEESEADHQPSLWTVAFGARNGVAVLDIRPSPGTILTKLHPLLLLKCTVVGDKLLSGAFRKHHGGTPRGGRGFKVPLHSCPFGINANGFEDLLLAEVRGTVSGWTLGPMEKGLFEREIQAENIRLHLPPGLLSARMTRVRTIPQICQRVIYCEKTIVPSGRGSSRLEQATPRGSSSLVPTARSTSTSTSGAVNQQASEAAIAPMMQPSHSLASLQSQSSVPRTLSTAEGGGGRLSTAGSVAPKWQPSLPSLPLDESALVLCLPNSVLSSYDIPAILNIMGWNASQMIQAASLQASVAGMGSPPKLQHLRDPMWPNNDKWEAKTALTVLKATDGSTTTEAIYQSILSQPVMRRGELSLRKMFITKLVITGSEIDDSGVSSLVLGLRGLSQLQALDLSENASLTWRCCAAIAELVNTNFKSSFQFPKHSLVGCGDCRLQTLVLNSVAVGDRGADLLCRHLAHNSVLTTLSLQHAKITRHSSGQLANMLLENLKLQELRLGWNQIGAVGAELIAASLKGNGALKRLDISNNGLSDLGGSHLAVCLQENQVLEEVDMGGNSVSAGTCLVLSEALMRNTTLTVLLLDHNPLSEEGGDHLITAICQNSTLQRLGLQGCSFIDPVNEMGHKTSLFNRRNPNNDYVLHLHNPTHRQIATELVRLREKFGPWTWVDACLNGEPFKGPTEKDNWPERLPIKGTLELTYSSAFAPPVSTAAMGVEDFQNALQEMRHPQAVDFWRLSFLRTMCRTAFFTARQGVRLLQTFIWSKERVEACIVIFGRIIDTENLHVLTSIMNRNEERQLFAALGMAAYLRNENPTGRYSLNLSRELDRVIAVRLLLLAQKEPFWKKSKTMLNFRNVIVKGERIQITDPINYAFPIDGMVQFDFITYLKGTIIHTVQKNRRPESIPLANHKAIDNINFLRLVGAVQSMVELQQTKLQRQLYGEATMRVKTAAGTIMKERRQQLDPERWFGTGKTRKSLSVLVEHAEAYHKETSNSNTPSAAASPIDQTAFKAIIQQVDLEAEGLGKKIAEQVVAEEKEEEKGGVREASPDTATTPQSAGEATREAKGSRLSRLTQKAGGVKLFWTSAMERICSLNMIYFGMADMFDSTMPDITPHTVVRTFGNKHYCTCGQLLQLLWTFDPTQPDQSVIRVDIIQIMFCRIVDLWHFADILRNCSPPEQIQVMQRCGLINCIYVQRPNFAHLHGIGFLIRLSSPEEFQIGKVLADYVEHLPKIPSNDSKPIFRDLLINGSPATLSEDRKFWETLCTLAKNRARPDDTWDPVGTLEFRLMLPDAIRRSIAAVRVQTVWRARWAHLAFLRFQKAAHMVLHQQGAAKSVAHLLAGGKEGTKAPGIADRLLTGKAAATLDRAGHALLVYEADGITESRFSPRGTT